MKFIFLFFFKRSHKEKLRTTNIFQMFHKANVCERRTRWKHVWLVCSFVAYWNWQEFDDGSFSAELCVFVLTPKCVRRQHNRLRMLMWCDRLTLFACWENSETLCRHNFITSMHAFSASAMLFGWNRFGYSHSYSTATVVAEERSPESRVDAQNCFTHRFSVDEWRIVQCIFRCVRI